MNWQEFLTKTDIVVVASNHRQPKTTEFLCDVPYKISYTFDYEFNSNEYVKDIYAHYLCNSVGALRCYKGHQDALKLVSDHKIYILVLEDDAIFRDNYKQKILSALNLLEEFDIVSLHGRNLDLSSASVINNGEKFYVFPHVENNQINNIHGSLAYLIKNINKNKIISRPFDGLPMDLFIASQFKFAVIADSPFVHDTSVHSVLGNAKSIKK